MEPNPYAAPAAQPLDYTPGAPGDAESIRREHIKHEVSVKGIGTLYFIGALFVVLGAGGLLVGQIGSGRLGASEIGITTLFLALGILGFWVGYGIRKLSPAARVVAGVLTGINLVISLFGLPTSVVAILINTYILNLLFSKKGGMVFSAPYKDIIAATPHVKYKTSIVVWIVLGIFVLAVVGGIAALFFSDRH
jgi:hypothetical protein